MSPSYQFSIVLHGKIFPITFWVMCVSRITFCLLYTGHEQTELRSLLGLPSMRPATCQNRASEYKVLRSAELQRLLEQHCIRFFSVLKIWVWNNFIFFQCKEVWVFFIICLPKNVVRQLPRFASTWVRAWTRTWGNRLLRPLFSTKHYENDFVNRCVSCRNFIPPAVVKARSISCFRRLLSNVDLSSFTHCT